jgi:hypothetical protein
LDADLSFLDTLAVSGWRGDAEGQCTAHRTRGKGVEIALAVATDRASAAALQVLL